MKAKILGTISALALSASLLPTVISSTDVAHAQSGFVPNAPFVTDAGIDGATPDRHYIEVAVATFPISGLIIECTNLAGVGQTMVTDEAGGEIEATSEVSEGSEGGTSVTVNFSQPIEPGNTLRVVLDGVEVNRRGGQMLYRVSAVNSDLPYSFPVGAAMLLEPDLTN